MDRGTLSPHPSALGDALPEAPTLADLRNLPLEQRSAHLLQRHRPELTETLTVLQRAQLPASPALDPRRLAWALAFNIDGPPAPEPDSHPQRRSGARGYCDQWPAETPWLEVWSALARSSKVRTDPDHALTFLGELALSVACEQRDDWQNPEARPLRPSACEAAFEAVYHRNHSKVLGSVLNTLSHLGGNAEHVACEAWSRIFQAYWAQNARRRFLGLCSIATLVHQIARYVAIDASRSQRREDSSSPSPDATDDSHASPSELDRVAVQVDPDGALRSEEIRQALAELLTRLPPKRRIVAHMIWILELPAKRVAEILGVSEPAVSQHLKEARRQARDHLLALGLLPANARSLP